MIVMLQVRMEKEQFVLPKSLALMMHMKGLKANLNSISQICDKEFNVHFFTKCVQSV